MSPDLFVNFLGHLPHNAFLLAEECSRRDLRYVIAVSQTPERINGYRPRVVLCVGDAPTVEVEHCPRSAGGMEIAALLQHELRGLQDWPVNLRPVFRCPATSEAQHFEAPAVFLRWIPLWNIQREMMIAAVAAVDQYLQAKGN